MRRQVYYLPGGHRRIIYTRAVTVAEQIVRELCLEMNILSINEQQEFVLCYILDKGNCKSLIKLFTNQFLLDNTMKMLNNDEYVLDVITELEAKETNNDSISDYILILTRNVWIHPLRIDNQLYTDALFFQIMPNYIAGLLTWLCNGNIMAAILVKNY